MFPRDRLLLAIAVLAFVSLGLPDGVLGVAWPSVRRTFDLPLSQLGVFLAGSMVGYLASSFWSGAIVARIGVGRLLLLSSVGMVAALVGYALAPAWWVMVALGVLSGLGAGAIDAGINAFAAIHCSPRRVNWLHASYGLGAMAGPLLMTGLLAAGLSWRWGYGLIGAMLAGMASCFALTVDLWPSAAPTQGSPRAQPGDSPAGVLATLRHPLVGLQICLFFVYTGLEVTAGQWSYSLLTEARGVPPEVAGIWIGAYWASLTAGRLVFGALARRVSSDTILRLGLAMAPVGALAIWMSPGWIVTFCGLVLLGFSFAPIFPLLIAATPKRVGAARAIHAIGFQISAAYLGAAALPGAVGVLARWWGLEVIGPFLLVAAAGLVLLHESALWLGARGQSPHPRLAGSLGA